MEVALFCCKGKRLSPMAGPEQNGSCQVKLWKNKMRPNFISAMFSLENVCVCFIIDSSLSGRQSDSFLLSKLLAVHYKPAVCKGVKFCLCMVWEHPFLYCHQPLFKEFLLLVCCFLLVYIYWQEERDERRLKGALLFHTKKWLWRIIWVYCQLWQTHG